MSESCDNEEDCAEDAEGEGRTVAILRRISVGLGVAMRTYDDYGRIIRCHRIGEVCRTTISTEIGRKAIRHGTYLDQHIHARGLET